MIDHEHALELAAAALDFGLSDEDRAALQAHLDGCADCRSADQLLRADAQRVADLSMRDAPDRLRGRVLASAGTSARGERPASAASGASVQRPPIIPRRHRRLAAVLATAAVVVVLIGGTLFWQTTSNPSRGVAASSPSPSDSTPPPSGGPGASPVDDTSAPVADMTADDIEGGVVALSSGFRLASRDGRPAADLAAGLKVDPPISFVVAPEGDGRSVHITPSEPLKAGTIYRFRLTAPDGRTLDSWAFQAHQPLQVSATLPRDTTTDVPTDTGIEVTFDQDGVVDAKGHFSIVPKVGGRFEQHGRTLAFVPTKRLARHTIYTVTISRGVEVGGTGERLEADVRFRFETAGGPKARVVYQFTNDLVDAGTARPPALALWVSPERVDDGRPPKPPKTVRILVDRLPDLDAAVVAYRQVRQFPHWARGATGPVVSTKGLPRVAAFDARLRTSETDGFSWFPLPDRLPAGWYVVSLPSATQTIQSIIQVTDVAGYVAISTTKTVVWVNDLASDGPIRGASVAIGGVDAGHTGDDGTLIVDTPASLTGSGPVSCTDDCSSVVIVRSGGRAMFMPTEEDDRPSYASEPYTEDSAYWSTFDTDRTLYRRTDTINAWGVVRARPSRDVPATVVVELFSALDGDAAQAPLWTTEVHPNEVGAYSTSIALDDLPEGAYDVVSRVGNEVVGSTSIEIARILKPAYRLDVTTGRRIYFVGDRIKVTATATFFEGSPVPGVPLRADGLVTRSFTTDAKGIATLQTTARSEGENAYGTADVRVLSVSPARAEEGEIAGASREIVVYPSTWVVDGAAVMDAGRARVTGTVRAVDRDRLEREIAGGKSAWELEPAGTPIANGKVTATFTELIPYSNQVGTRYDFIEKKVVPVFQGGTTERPAGAVTVTTGADGTFDMSIPATTGGHDYQVRISAKDPDGHTARWLGFATTPETQRFGDDGVLLPTSGIEDERYGIGDPVDVTMRGKTGGRYLFYTAEQGIRDVSTQSSPRFRTTFADWAPPDFHITGVRFTGSGYIQSQSYVARFRQTDRELVVGLSTDADRYAPGAEVRLSVTTRDHSGRPVPATVVLRAVDEKLFAIGGAQAAEPLAELYSDVSSGIVSTYRSHREPRYRGEGGDTTGGGGDGLGRHDFRDAVLFKQITTGADGSATVNFHVSDDLTSWRVSASAFGDGLTAGEAWIGIPVGRPFFVDATIAPQYLASDRPVIGLRAYGTALDTGAAVTFAVESEDLGLHVTRLKAKAFETASVPLPKLTLGTHSLTITATSGSGASAQRDVMTRTFTVVGSRLARTMTAYVEPTSATHPKGGDGRVDVIVTDAGPARYVPLLLGLTGTGSARLEPALASSLAGTLLKDRYGIAGLESASTFDAPSYQMGDGGLAILPYASSSVEVSALTALVAPDSVDPSQLRAYLSDIAGRPKATREARNFALAGLAGLHAPVLPRLRAAISDPKLTVRERLMLGLGAAAIGDAATARAVGAALEAEFGEVTGDLARLRVGKSTADITQATALMAMLAAATADPLAARLWATVEADPGNDLPYGLHAIGFVIRTLERAAPRPASFAYVVGGKREVIDLESGKAFHLSLNQREFRSLTIETLGGQIGVTTSWAETVKPASYAKDPDITISRRITPSGKIGTAALVRVDLTVHLGPKAPSGCHLVTDLVPSGLVAVGSLESFVAANDDDDQARNVTYPLSQVGQRISFCAEKRPKTGDVRLRYFARVVTAGTYTWEPAVAESRSRAGRAAVTKTGVITIR